MDERRENKPAILIFAKAPIPGHCKTRMQPQLSEEGSADLQDTLFKDLMLLKDELEPDCMVWIAYDPPHCKPYFQQFHSRLIVQQGKDLGERMQNGLHEIFLKHDGPVLILGTDTPLSKADIQKAFHLLLHPGSIVIGPTWDGGYYALGMYQYEPLLFQEITWSTDRVFQQTCGQAQKLGLEVTQLDRKRDIDRWDDLIYYRDLTTNPHFDRWKNGLIPEKELTRNVDIQKDDRS